MKPKMCKSFDSSETNGRRTIDQKDGRAKQMVEGGWMGKHVVSSVVACETLLMRFGCLR